MNMSDSLDCMIDLGAVNILVNIWATPTSVCMHCRSLLVNICLANRLMDLLASKVVSLVTKQMDCNCCHFPAFECLANLVNKLSS